MFRIMPSSPAFWAAGTHWRPGDPASHHRRGRSWVDWEGCDHTDGTPAACLVAGTADRIALPEGARSVFVRSGMRRREVVPAQMRTRHPDGAGFSARQVGHRGQEGVSAADRCCLTLIAASVRVDDME